MSLIRADVLTLSIWTLHLSCTIAQQK